MYLIKVLQKCSLSSPLPNMYMNFFQTAEFDWFHGNQNVEFANKY